MNEHCNETFYSAFPQNKIYASTWLVITRLSDKRTTSVTKQLD